MNLNHKEKIIYTSALLEGEGCFGIRKIRIKRPRIQCGMTDEDIINRLLDWWGGSKYHRDKGENRKRIYNWILRSPESINDLCSSIYKYMGNRRQKKIEKVNKIAAQLIQKKINRASKYQIIKNKFDDFDGTQKDLWRQMDTDWSYHQINKIIRGEYDRHIQKYIKYNICYI